MFEVRIFIVSQAKEDIKRVRTMIQERKVRNGIQFRVVGESQSPVGFEDSAESLKPHCLIIDENLINKAVIDTGKGISVIAITSENNRREGEIDHVNLDSGSGFVVQKIESTWMPFTVESLRRADAKATQFYKHYFPGLDYAYSSKEKKKRRPAVGSVFIEPRRKEDDVPDGSFNFTTDDEEQQLSSSDDNITSAVGTSNSNEGFAFDVQEEEPVLKTEDSNREEGFFFEFSTDDFESRDESSPQRNSGQESDSYDCDSPSIDKKPEEEEKPLVSHQPASIPAEVSNDAKIDEPNVSISNSDNIDVIEESLGGKDNPTNDFEEFSATDFISSMTLWMFLRRCLTPSEKGARHFVDRHLSNNDTVDTVQCNSTRDDDILSSRGCEEAPVAVLLMIYSSNMAKASQKIS